MSLGMYFSQWRSTEQPHTSTPLLACSLLTKSTDPLYFLSGALRGACIGGGKVSSWPVGGV